MSKKKKKKARPQVWWMCLNPYSQTAPMVRHESFAEAQVEAMRLCQKEGKKVHVVELVGTAHPPTTTPTWEFRREAFAVATDQLVQTQSNLREARNKCAELQAGLDDIEEYGTEEINAAVDLRHQLAKALCERDKAISVAERLVEYAHECLVKLQSWGQGYRRYEEEMDSIREDIAAYDMMKEAAK